MHALSGCDTVSFFNGIEKKTAWDIWRSLPNLKTLFCRLSQTPEKITEADMEELERFVVLLLSRTSNRRLENIPPSKAALLQHVKRAPYQAGHVWGQALIANPSLPSPSNGAGRRTKTVTGHLCGLYYQKLPRDAENW